MLPCCYLNSEALEIAATKKGKTKFGKIWSDSGGVFANNLKYNTISEVIDGEMFDLIQESWLGSLPVEKCWNTCKVKKRDIFIDKEI